MYMYMYTHTDIVTLPAARRHPPVLARALGRANMVATVVLALTSRSMTYCCKLPLTARRWGRFNRWGASFSLR